MTAHKLAVRDADNIQRKIPLTKRTIAALLMHVTTKSSTITARGSEESMHKFSKKPSIASPTWEQGHGARFHPGFCRVRVKVIGLRLLYGARFSTEIYNRGCHWFPRLCSG
jgi:hypothetical protein